MLCTNFFFIVLIIFVLILLNFFFRLFLLVQISFPQILLFTHFDTLIKNFFYTSTKNIFFLQKSDWCAIIFKKCLEVSILTYNIKIFGIVQGVGFRPFIKNLADNFFISDNVAYRGSYVDIFVQNSQKFLKNLLDAVKKFPPPRSAVLKIDRKNFDKKSLYQN